MKKILFTILIVISVIAIIIGIYIYKTRYHVIKLDSSVSDDEKYELTLYTVGESGFPFGYVHGKIELKSKGQIVSETEIDLANDGEQITSERWKVLWKEDYAKVYLYASEQPNEEWHFYFDGKVEQKKQEFVATDNNKLNVNIYNTEDNFIAFSSNIDNYIEVMNHYYRHYHLNDYLYSLDEWSEFEDVTQYYNYNSKYYYFVRDKKINCLPTISVYTPLNEIGIYEIKLTFDNHGYREETYKEYTEIVKSTLKAFLPKLSFDEIDKIYDKIYLSSDDNFWGESSYKHYSERPKLKQIYCYENIGIYAYYGAGDANICIIPMTVDIQKQFETDGIKIENIEQFQKH